MLITAVALFIVPVLFGAGILTYYRICNEKTTCVLMGALLGYILTTFCTYIFDLFVASPLWALNIILAAELFIGFINYKVILKNWRELGFNRVILTIFIVVLLLMFPAVSKLLFWEDGVLKTGIINAWGDLGWHVSNITMFAEGQSVPPENPILAGNSLVYPFLSNYFSGLFLAAGVDLSIAVTFPAVFFIPLVVTLFYLLTVRLTGDTKVALVAIILLLLGGATFGWVRFVDDWNNSGRALMAFVFHLPHRDYFGSGTNANGFHFLNPVLTLLLPQRPFLFGLPLAITILYLLLPDNNIASAKRYSLAGVMAGVLPLFHAHTVLALIPPITALFLVKREKSWRYFVVLALLIGSPAVYYLLTNIGNGGSFLRWGPRWMAGDDNLIIYWFKNTGLLIPVSLVGVFITSLPKIARYLAGAGLIILVAANLFLFAPWVWDNYKLIVYWYVFSLPLIGLVIVRAYRKSNHPVGRAIIIALVLAHVLSGALDLWKISLPTAVGWQEWGKDELIMADIIKEKTEPGDTIATAPIHNSPVALAGRPIYLGYAGHIWSHGYNSSLRDQNLTNLYEKGELVEEGHQPEYLLVGPVERRRYLIKADWEPVAKSSSYTLYKLPTSE